MILAADGGGEIQVAAVGTPAAVTRLEIPVRSQVDRLASLGRTDVEIARSSMIQFLLNDHVRPERARVGKELAVGRVTDVAVDVPVLRELGDLAVQRHRPEIGLRVLEVVTPR